MSHFIIAGAGHGGLTAALALVRAGHTAEVIEQKKEADLGYDWMDTIEPQVIERNGFPALPEGSLGTVPGNTLLGPSKASPKREPHKRAKYVWRSVLLRHMVNTCREAGVRFQFETTLSAPLMEGLKVAGVLTQQGEFRGDMVIDAAGAFSPIRRGLPEASLVPREIRPDQIFNCWRGLFERLPGGDPQDLFKTYLYHIGRKGISWAVHSPGLMDVLIGSIGCALSEADVEAALLDLRKDNPLLGEKLLHGGQFVTIPVRRSLSVMVTDGYAAVGDSACMADPFNGSGINIAIDAGTLLAQTLLELAGDYSAAKLWGYQHKFFSWTPPAEYPEGVGAKTAEQKAETDMLKTFMLTLSSKEVDLLFDRNILTAELLFMGAVMTPVDAVKLVLRNLSKISLLLKLAKMISSGDKIKEITRRIPTQYDKAAIAQWAKEYEGFSP